jgi:hypothetical protein
LSRRRRARKFVCADWTFGDILRNQGKATAPAQSSRQKRDTNGKLDGGETIREDAGAAATKSDTRSEGAWRGPG